jgi:hypothetical protein
MENRLPDQNLSIARLAKRPALSCHKVIDWNLLLLAIKT